MKTKDLSLKSQLDEVRQAHKKISAAMKRLNDLGLISPYDDINLAHLVLNAKLLLLEDNYAYTIYAISQPKLFE